MEFLKEDLDVIFKNDTVKVVFEKKDGTERTMICTRNLIPEDKQPKEGSAIRKKNEELFPVYDIESNGWRSFRIDSVKSVEVI